MEVANKEFFCHCTGVNSNFEESGAGAGLNICHRSEAELPRIPNKTLQPRRLNTIPGEFEFAPLEFEKGGCMIKPAIMRPAIPANVIMVLH